MKLDTDKERGMSLNIDELKAAALAATPGEWLYRTDPGNPTGFQHCVRLPGEFGAWVCDCLDNADKLTAGGIAGERNAAYIAAANPTVVLSLIAELEQLRAARNAGLSQEPVGDSLRHAAQVIELYDDATMQGDYMQSSTDCAGIIEALVEYHARFTAPPAPVGAEPVDPMPNCPRCDGSGEELVLDSAGPDAVEIPVDCTHCGGAGSLSATYTHLVAKLAASEAQYLKACGEIYFLNLNATKAPPTPAAPLSDAKDSERLDWIERQPAIEIKRWFIGDAYAKTGIYDIYRRLLGEGVGTRVALDAAIAAAKEAT